MIRTRGVRGAAVPRRFRGGYLTAGAVFANLKHMSKQPIKISQYSFNAWYFYIKAKFGFDHVNFG
jgi:hypothetical protein